MNFPEKRLSFDLASHAKNLGFKMSNGAFYLPIKSQKNIHSLTGYKYYSKRKGVIAAPTLLDFQEWLITVKEVIPMSVLYRPDRTFYPEITYEDKSVSEDSKDRYKTVMGDDEHKSPIKALESAIHMAIMHLLKLDKSK